MPVIMDDHRPLIFKPERKLFQFMQGLTNTVMILFFHIEQQKASASGSQQFPSFSSGSDRPYIAIFNSGTFDA